MVFFHRERERERERGLVLLHALHECIPCNSSLCSLTTVEVYPVAAPISHCTIFLTYLCKLLLRPALLHDIAKNHAEKRRRKDKEGLDNKGKSISLMKELKVNETNL